MIFLVGKISSFYRETPLLSFFHMFKSQGISTKILAPNHLYNWEKLKRYNISKSDFSSIQEIVCQREDEKFRLFGLKELGLGKYQLIKGKNFYFVDNGFNKKATVSFFDAKNTLFKEVSYTNSERRDEFDDRGFIFSQTVIANGEKNRLFLDKDNHEKIRYFYKNESIKKIVLSSSEIFYSESEFFAWELSRLIKAAKKEDRFLLFDVNEVYPFLTKEICKHPQLYIVPNFDVTRASVLTENGKIPNGVFLETNKEVSYYRKQSFYHEAAFSLYSCNYFTAEGKEITEVQDASKKKIYLNLGKLPQKDGLEDLLNSILELGKKQNVSFIIELQGVRSNLFVREYIATHSAEQVFQLIGNPHTRTIENSMKEITAYLLLDSHQRSSLSLMKAIENRRYLIVPKDSIYAEWVEDNHFGKVIGGEDLALFRQPDSLIQNHISDHSVIEKYFSKKLTTERIIKRLYAEDRNH